LTWESMYWINRTDKLTKRGSCAKKAGEPRLNDIQTSNDKNEFVLELWYGDWNHELNLRVASRDRSSRLSSRAKPTSWLARQKVSAEFENEDWLPEVDLAL